MRKTILSALVLLPVGFLALAQADKGVAPEGPRFDSRSDGSDGPLIILTPSADPRGYLFDPRDPSTFDPDGVNQSAQLDVDGDGVYHFTRIEIGEGVVVKLRSVPLNTKPAVWLSQEAIQIEGTLDLDGEPGHGIDPPLLLPAIAGAGGYSGGVGGDHSRDFVGQRGSGPGGGAGSQAPGGCMQPGGHVFPASICDEQDGGNAYGNIFLLPLLGGSGGGGQWGTVSGAGGGGGGGALLLASSESITVNGEIRANGGGGGGTTGGSGGSIRLVAPRYEGTGLLSAEGGVVVTRDRWGSAGRIRVEAFDFPDTLRSEPTARTSVPGRLFPDAPPSVRVVNIAGADLPANPIGDPLQPDVEIDESGEVEILIESQNIPVGARVQLNIQSDNGPPTLIEAEVEGTFEAGTGTARLRLPPGLSRFSVLATWNPEE